MDILTILKFRLGISTAKRDDYLKAIIKGIQNELKEVHGIIIPETKDESGNITFPDHISMFIVDYAEFRYNSRGETGGMPDHLKFRLRNLYAKPRNEA